jgi:triosephosphate isomerase (TIM)
MARTPLLAGNWKMYKTVAEALELAEGLLAGLGDVAEREVLICPPFTALHALRPVLEGTPVRLGAQNMYYEVQGAFTGEVSPVMLKELGCTYVVVGHSERRQIFGESDELIGKKLRAAGNAENVTLGQLRACLAGVTAGQMSEVVVAYEPVWAIGTGDTATPADAQAMHAAIRGALGELFGAETADGVRIQYGGSVKPDNVDELMAQPDIDGALVGGASLKAESFLRIVQFR